MGLFLKTLTSTSPYLTEVEEFSHEQSSDEPEGQCLYPVGTG